MRVRTQLVIALSALAGLTASVIVAINFFYARDILFHQIQSQVLSIATTAASQIDANTHEQIRTAGDQTTAEYKAQQAKLRAIRDANRRDDVYVRFIYTMHPTGDGRWTYVVDAEEPGDDFSPLGSAVEFERREPLHMDRPYAEKAFYRDSFGTWLSANAPIHDAQGKPVALLGVDLVASNVAAHLQRLLLAGITAGLIALVAAIGIGFLIARWFTAPLERIGETVRRIGAGELDAEVKMERRDEFGRLAQAVNQMGQALRERNALKGALARLVSHEVADEIMAGQAAPVLRGTSKQITVLIVDIRNFTAMSGELVPDHLVEFLNEFFGRLIDPIFSHRGTLDKFLGDGCLAIFGAPIDDPTHQRQAVLAAQEILKSIAEQAAPLQEKHGIELRIGIGLHTGPAIVGYVGSEARMEYTAIGGTVNIASRLETMNKEYGTQLLMSEEVVKGAGEGFDFREIAEVTPRGASNPLKIFTLAEEP